MKKYFVTIAIMVLCLKCMNALAQDTIVVRTVPDKGRSGMYFAKLCPKYNVTIDKHLGDVFTVYTDGATARFSQGIFQGGKYVIPAGECVIIKTRQETDVQVVPTTSRRSSFPWSDMICPDEDMSLEDFKAKYNVTVGKYIYMLTNLSRNGGFGFTHFGGKTMKAGNFYIINTRKPTGSTGMRLPIVRGDTSAVYNLKGEKVTNPTAPGIYIRNGKKFVVK